MQRSSKDAWLASDAGDLDERDVHDVPVRGQSVRVRALPAAYSNKAMSKATVFKTVTSRTGRAEQVATIDQEILQVLQFQYGVVDPKFDERVSQMVAEKFGPAFERVVEAINDLSGIDEEAIKNAEARFPAGGPSETGKDVGVSNGSGDSGPAVPARAGRAPAPNSD